MRYGRAIIADRPRFGEVLGDRFYPLENDLFSKDRSRAGRSAHLDEIRLLSPLNPRVVLLMVNAFLAEGAKLPKGEVPWMTPKYTSRIVGDRGVIFVPSFVGEEVWAEVELAVVIGREIFEAGRSDARKAIFGYTIFNDVTTGEIKPTMDFFQSKCIEGFASMGPWIDTDISEQRIEAGLDLVATVNGETRVEGSTKDYKFSVVDVVRFASKHTRLFPGDVISLGTPGPCRMRPGEVVHLSVTGVGTMQNTFTR